MSTRVVTSKLRQPSWASAPRQGKAATAAPAALVARNALRSMRGAPEGESGRPMYRPTGGKKSPAAAGLSGSPDG